MSHLIARILLTVLIFPATVLFYCVAFIFLDRLEFRDDEQSVVVITALGSAAFMIGYWFLLWRRTVRWTRRRVAWTFAGFGGAAVIGVLLAAAINRVLEWDQWVGAFFGIACGSVIWIVTTIFAWRETAAERAARLGGAGRDAVVCPNCGYNLTGLSGTRCPECGKQYTINELLAEQPARAAAEVEAN